MTVGLLWVLSVLLILIGLAGTVLPALPGTALVLGASCWGPGSTTSRVSAPACWP